jgi:hypothetical protein
VTYQNQGSGVAANANPRLPVRHGPIAWWLALPGFFVRGNLDRRLARKGDLMANHFTPAELAEELGTETRDVIQFCVREAIPIYKGKVDRSLLMTVMKAKGVQFQKAEAAAV